MVSVPQCRSIFLYLFSHPSSLLMIIPLVILIILFTPIAAPPFPSLLFPISSFHLLNTSLPIAILPRRLSNPLHSLSNSLQPVNHSFLLIILSSIPSHPFKSHSTSAHPTAPRSHLFTIILPIHSHLLFLPSAFLSSLVIATQTQFLTSHPLRFPIYHIRPLLNATLP